MFKVLRRRQESPSKRKADRKSASKWSLDRALCQGSGEKISKDQAVPDSASDTQNWQDFTGDEVTTRVIGVALERDPEHGLGINLRPSGGPQGQLIVTHVKPYGPADREGSIKVGDRLLAVDGQRLGGLNLAEAQRLLTACGTGRLACLTIEYDISVMDRLRNTGPLLVEIDRGNEITDLGLSLVDSPTGVIVSRVRTAGIAERCGAFLPGDQILAVNQFRVDRMSVIDVHHLLTACDSSLLQIEVLPIATSSPRLSSFAQSISSRKQASCTGQLQSQLIKPPRGESLCNGQRFCDQDINDNNLFHKLSPSRNNYSRKDEPPPLPHPNLINEERFVDPPELRIESGLVTLNSSPGQGYGLEFRTTNHKKGVIVCFIQPHGVADRSGALQVGDRLLSANGHLFPEGVTTLEEIVQGEVKLAVQFDVEVHRCQIGVKQVRLERTHSSGFGFIITDSSDGGIVVSEVQWGSIAHRSGMMRVGDRLVAIDGNKVDDMGTAMRVFRKCGQEVVFHLISPDSHLDMGYSSPGLPSVDSAVESWDSGMEPALLNGYRCLESSDFAVNQWRQDDPGTESVNSLTTQQSDEEEETCSSLRLSESIADGNRVHLPPPRPPPSPPCPLQTNYKTRKVTLPLHWRGSSINTNALENLDHTPNEPCTQPVPQVSSFTTFRGPKSSEVKNSARNQPQSVFQVTLYKSMLFDDFGFSVSDGLYEKGVFVNTIKPGSPADMCGMLRQYDKIVQVNDVPTHDLDCCLTVPLMASAGKKLTLTLVRYQDRQGTGVQQWVEEVAEEAQPECQYKHTETL
ncbi:glutamate receptor interacting protein isoform X1 [Rhodnius prolixus]|uniref:glutamate receptor interacting protein isoform X1 n=1 Tax=Rhodnius prolixus TaxID=13249 RepID=UPI003D18C157